MMKSKRLLLTLLMALLVPWAAMAQECEISYTLTDSYGDGWNGGALVVTDVTTSTQLADLTISSGSSLTGSIPVINEHEISFAYTPGSWAGENSWAIYDANGSLIWQGSGSDGSQTYSYVAVCPSCYMPQALAVTLTPGNGTIATLNWTAGGTETNWVLEYGTASDFTGATSVNVSGTPTQDLTGLTAETTYYARVKADCGNGDESGWTDPISFIPTNAYSITVNDGTSTNSYVPYYAYYHDASQRSEFIIPAASLTSMAWGTITSMKLYPNYSYTTTASIQVYLMEVEATTFSDVTFYTEADATVVYNGTLTISPNGLIINLNGDGFEYNGGNLLVGFYQASGGNGYYSSSACPFYGVNADGASISQYSSYSGLRNFLPKTTFEFTPGEEPTCFKPTGLAVARITINSADLTWEPGADETQWQICLNDDETNLILVNENSYSLTNLIPDTDYTVKVRAYCGADDQSSWTANVSFSTEVACPVPTNVTVSDIAATSAVVSWTGEASSYNLRYREMTDEDYATITFAPNDVWQDGTGYQLLLDADATAYGTIIPETGGLTSVGDASAAVYAEFEYKIPASADGAMNTQNVLIGESVTIRVPAGTFDWCVTNPTPGDRIWIAGEGRADDYVFEGGKTYLFVVQSNGNGGDEVVVTVSETGSAKADEWTTINDVTSPYTITVEPEKDYIVEVQANCGQYLSNWVRKTFSTPSNCQTPTPLDVTDITANTATLNWTGLQDSYQVQYRTKGSRELLFFEDFDGQPSTWTLTNAAYERTSSQTTDYFVYLGYNSTETAYLITPDLTDIVSVGTVEFYHRSYNGDATFQVGFSSTTNDVDAFTWGEEVSAAGVFFTAYDVAMPAGTKYVAVKSTTSAEDNYVFINDFGIYGNEIPAGQWNTATANGTTCPISNLDFNTEYEWQVRGVNESCEGGYTEWSTMATFTTLNPCLVPVIDNVDNIEATTATVHWTGAQESFNVRYSEFEQVSLINFNDGEIPADWRNDETYPWTIVDGHIQSSNAGVASSTSTISFTATYASAGVISFDAMFMGEGTSYDKCIFSIDGTQMFAYGAIGEEWYNMAYYFAAGEHTFTWTYSKDSSVDPDGDFFAIDNIKIQLQGDTWTTIENVTGNSYDLTGLTPDAVIAVQVQGNNTVCDGGVTDWSEEYFFMTDELVLPTQTIELAEGWNWISTYIDLSEGNGIAMLEEALGDNAIQIATQDDSAEYFGDGFWLGLEDYEWTNGDMVMVECSSACTVTLEGPAVDPTTVEITIYPEWNWIGYPVDIEMSIDDALSGFEPEFNDNFGDYYGTSDYLGAWIGDIETLVPGQGYMYYSASDEVKTLVYQTGAGKLSRRLGGIWDPRKVVVRTLDIDQPAKRRLSSIQETKSITKSIN